MARQVDHAEIKTGQLLTMLMSTLAFFLQDTSWLIALGLIFLVTALARPLSPFVLTYRYLIAPTGLMHSDYRLDNIQPHSFGQLIGAVTVGVVLLLHYSGFEWAAWSVVGVLFGLTLVSYLGWCIGCFLYYQFNRLGLKGFFRHAPTDRSVTLGSRPKTQQTAKQNDGGIKGGGVTSDNHLHQLKVVASL